MNLIIVSGLSGSGKSIALHALEDLGYFCIDNLPFGMLPQLAAQLQRSSSTGIESAAVSIDSRSREFLETLKTGIDELRAAAVTPRIVFLEADTERLLQRYSETRRRHPLTDEDTPLLEGILRERELLTPLADAAERTIDTSIMTPYELRVAIRGFAQGTLQSRPTLLFQSFGFKRGAPSDADTVFDLRCLPNPYWETELRDFCGLDRPVIDFLERTELVHQMAAELKSFISFWIKHFDVVDRSYLTVALGCTGGQHRSVYMVERLAREFREIGDPVQIRHRDLPPAQGR
ncbi:MAG: RNase adapter RapZ [Arenicellales bacterium]|nr:RNase adapter RapZ [Arenicellales bacterium]